MHNKHDKVRAAARRMVSGMVLAGAGLVLSACSGGSGGSAASANAVHFGGKALGGQQPVVGATVTLYTAGTAGYGAGTPELGHGTTGSGGAWTITLASCPAGDPQLYLVATGGKSIATATSDNTAAVMSAALGPCSTANGATNIDINEVTTVAAAFALSGFLDDTGRQLGTSATNATGLANAAANAGVLADYTTGQARTALLAASGSTGTATLPAATVNTLANILAACVNSTGADSAACTTLLGSGGASASDALQAAVHIARSPLANISNLFSLSTANAPFQNPAPLSAAPHDWTLPVIYTGGTLGSAPKARVVAIDADGDAWVGTANALIPVGPQGQQFGTSLTGGGITNANGIVIDGSGNVWVSGSNGSVNGFTSAGSTISGSPFTFGSSAASLNGAMATDSTGNIWIADISGVANSLGEIMPAGGGAYSAAAFPVPNAPGAGTTQIFAGIQTDASGNVWMAYKNTHYLAMVLGTNPATVSQFNLNQGQSNQLGGLAIDSSGNVWSPAAPSAGPIGNGVIKQPVAGGAATQYFDNAIVTPGAIAIDGAGKVWVFNQISSGNTGLVVLGSDGSALTGSTGQLTGGVLAGTASVTSGENIALDASGDVWVANLVGFSGKLVEFIGVATPVKTPLIGPAQLP